MKFFIRCSDDYSRKKLQTYLKSIKYVSDTVLLNKKHIVDTLHWSQNSSPVSLSITQLPLWSYFGATSEGGAVSFSQYSCFEMVLQVALKYCPLLRASHFKTKFKKRLEMVPTVKAKQCQSGTKILPFLEKRELFSTFLQKSSRRGAILKNSAILAGGVVLFLNMIIKEKTAPLPKRRHFLKQPPKGVALAPLFSQCIFVLAQTAKYKLCTYRNKEAIS